MRLKNILLLAISTFLMACSSISSDGDELIITSRFNSTWNIYEGIVRNDDGSITYHALPWGGLVGAVKEHNMPADWSGYESIRFVFSEPAKVPMQIMVSDKLKTWGKAGITSLTCYFDGQNVTSIDEVALQASDTTVITVKSVYLTPGNAVWESTPIWKGNCAQGNWQNGFVIAPEKFTTAYEGDKLEIIFTTDKSNPDVTFWMMKTIYNGTDSTLQGNDNELNKWGCATMGKEATSYRIVLTAHDVAKLREKGMFINGYYNTITQCNLLRKSFSTNADK